jgi:DedD protein
MERKLQERMIGAAVLVIALVIIGPLVLDGGQQGDLDTDAIPGQRSDELHTRTIDLRAPAAAAVATPAPVAVPAAAPAVAPAAVPPAAAASVAEAEVAAAPGMPEEATVVQQPAPSPEKPPAPARPVASDLPSPAPAPAAQVPATGGAWLVQVGTFSQKGQRRETGSDPQGWRLCSSH